VNVAHNCRVIGALACVLAGLTAASILLAVQLAGDRSEQARRVAVLQAARQQATTVTTYDYANFDAATARVLAGATGGFKATYLSGAGRLKSLVEREKSIARSDILEAGVVSVSRNSARVLLVGDVQVASGAQPPEVRRFRMQLDLVRTGGRWLTSDLRFVG
jgi:Mce-associated membrane protein